MKQEMYKDATIILRTFAFLLFWGPLAYSFIQWTFDMFTFRVIIFSMFLYATSTYTEEKEKK